MEVPTTFQYMTEEQVLEQRFFAAVLGMELMLITMSDMLALLPEESLVKVFGESNKDKLGEPVA